MFFPVTHSTSRFNLKKCSGLSIFFFMLHKPQLKIINVQIEKQRFLYHFCLEKGLKGTIVITSTVP